MNLASPFLRGQIATRVFLSFAGGYLLSYAFRSINAVIAPALLSELQLSNADLGLLSSAYLITFASLQLPLGIWLDKYGPRRTEAALLLFAAAGAVVFSQSSSLTGLWIGRAMIGVGVSACLMAPLKAFRLWFAPDRQSQLASWMLFAGTAGSLLATIPVTLAMPLIGWRGVFLVMAALILLIACAVFFLLREAEGRFPAQHQPAQGAASGTSAGGYRAIFGNPYFQRLALIGAVSQGSFVALQTLWVGPWMVTVVGLSKERASEALFAFNLCLMLSYLSLSWWAPRMVAQTGRRGWPVNTVIVTGLCGSLSVQTAMLFITGSTSWVLWLALSLFSPIVTLGQTQVSLSFPHAQVGRANSAYNLTVFLVAFAVQWGMGALIDAFRHGGLSPSDAMRAALAICIAVQALAVVAFAMHRGRNGRSTVC